MCMLDTNGQYCTKETSLFPIKRDFQTGTNLRMMDSDKNDGLPTDSSPFDVLNELNSKFQQSKATQIFRFLQDQEELNRKFDEYALNSEEEDSGSTGETENLLNQQLALRRSVKPPQAAWEDDDTEEEIGGAENISNISRTRPKSNQANSKEETLETNSHISKSKRKSGHSVGENTKAKRTLSKVSIRPQTALGYKNVHDMSSTPSVSPIPFGYPTTNEDQQEHLSYGSSIIPHPVTKGAALKQSQTLNNSRTVSMSQNYKKTTNQNKDMGPINPLMLPSENQNNYLMRQSEPVVYNTDHPLYQSPDYVIRRGDSAGTRSYAEAAGRLSVEGHQSLLGRSESTQPSLTLDVRQQLSLLRHRQGERQTDLSLLHGETRKDAMSQRGRASPSKSAGRLRPTSILNNFQGLEQGRRNMTVLKLPPLEGSVVAKPTVSGSALITPTPPSTFNANMAH